MSTIVYSLAPRGAVLAAARRVPGLELIPVLATGESENLPETGRVIEVADPLDPVQLCRVLLEEPDDGSRCLMTGFGDLSTQVAALVNAVLGWSLPGYLEFRTLETFRNKAKLRAALGEAHPVNLRFQVVHSAQEALRFAHDVGSEVVLKPLDGSGSRDVLSFSGADAAEVLAAGDLAWLEHGGIVEQRAWGTEFSVEMLSWQGEHALLGITEKFTSGAPHFIETGHQFPAVLSAESAAELEAAARQILDAAGHRSGLSHTELILTEAGAKLIESHGRPGGDRISDMVGLVRGRTSFELWFETLQQQRLADIPEAITAAGVAFVDLGSLKAADEEWLEQVRQVPGVVEASVLLPAADRGEIVSSSTRHSLVLFQAPSTEHDTIRTAITAATSKLK